MTDQEHDIQLLESQFPPASGQAFSTARNRVLASGQSILQSEGGFIYRVFPDGRKEQIKQIEPPVLVELGSKFIIR